MVEVPLVEEAERYQVGMGATLTPDMQWELVEPKLDLSVATLATLATSHSGKQIWVRQIGSHAASDPLLLHTIA